MVFLNILKKNIRLFGKFRETVISMARDRGAYVVKVNHEFVA